MGRVVELDVVVYAIVDALNPGVVDGLNVEGGVTGEVFTGECKENIIVIHIYHVGNRHSLMMHDLPTRTITPSRYIFMSATTHCATIIRFPLVTLMEMAPLLLLLSILYPSSLLATFARSLMLTVSTLQGSVYLHPLIGTG